MAAREADALRRALAEASPQATPNLNVSLNNLAHAEVGEQDEEGVGGCHRGRWVSWAG